MINKIKQNLFKNISENYSQHFIQQGFNINGKKWVKKNSTIIQEVNFYLAQNPKYHSNALIHIKPNLSIYFPEINKIAFQFFKGNEELLFGRKDSTFSQPVSLLLPKGNNEEIYIENSEDSFLKACVKLGNRLENAILPFFQDFSSIEQFINLYSKDDKRIVLKQEPYYVFITIAFILTNNIEGAKQIIDKHFSQRIFHKYKEILLLNLSYTKDKI